MRAWLCRGSLKLTCFLPCVMASKALDGASLGTLNSMMPNLIDAAYDNKILGDVLSLKTKNLTCKMSGRDLCCISAMK